MSTLTHLRVALCGRACPRTEKASAKVAPRTVGGPPVGRRSLPAWTDTRRAPRRSGLTLRPRCAEGGTAATAPTSEMRRASSRMRRWRRGASVPRPLSAPWTPGGLAISETEGRPRAIGWRYAMCIVRRKRKPWLVWRSRPLGSEGPLHPPQRFHSQRPGEACDDTARVAQDQASQTPRPEGPPRARSWATHLRDVAGSPPAFG